MLKKYKLKSVTALAVAGLAASAYACYYNVITSTTCFFSGQTIDRIDWADSTTSYVIATADFIIPTYTSTTGMGIDSTRHSGVTPLNCAGPAKFTDASGHLNTVNYWEADSNGHSAYPGTSPTIGSFGSASGTC